MTELSEKVNENIILIPCSGSEYHGELARQAAIRLSDKSKISSITTMTCSTIFLKNVLLGKEKLVEISKNHLNNSYIIIINGCNSSCASEIYRFLEIEPDLVTSVQDIIPKPHLNLNDLRTFKMLPKISDVKNEDISLVMQRILDELQKKGFNISD